MRHYLLSPDYLFLLQAVAWTIAFAPAMAFQQHGGHSAWRRFAWACAAFAFHALAEVMLCDLGDALIFAGARYLLFSIGLVLLVEFACQSFFEPATRPRLRWAPAAVTGIVAGAGYVDAEWSVVVRQPIAGIVFSGAGCALWRLAAKADPVTRRRMRVGAAGIFGFALSTAIQSLPTDPPFAASPFTPYDDGMLLGLSIRASSLLTLASVLTLQFNARHLRIIFGEQGSRLSRREFSWIGTTVLVLVAGWLATGWLEQDTDRDMRDAVTDRMRMAASVIAPGQIAGLHGDESDLASSNYQQLKQLLVGLTKANPDVRFAMLMSVRGEEVSFLADSEPPDSPDYSPPGQTYDETPEGYAAAVARGQPFVLGPITDRWGSWVSGSHPLGNFGPDLGWVSLDLDFSAAVWMKRVAAARLPGIAIVLLVTSLLLISFRAQWRIGESVAEITAVENRSASLVEGSPNAVLMLDSAGRAVSVNGNGLKSLRLEWGQVVGRSFLELWPAAFRAPLRSAIIRSFGGTVTTTEANYDIRGEEPLVFRITLSPISDGTNEIRHLVCICVDITERKRYEAQLHAAKEEAEAAARAKAEFLAVMSHEIRTPLGGVIGMLGLLRKLPQTPQQLHYTQLAHDSAEILLELLNDILDAAKIEAGRLTLENTAFDLRLELNRIVQCMRFKAVEKGLDLECSFAEEIPQLLEGDPTRLRQVLANFLSNALKFTERGKISVGISVERREGNQIVLRTRVSDTGIGMAPETQEKLFARFVQGDASTTRRYGGTGLGLSIAKHIVELMSGHVEVNSAVGQGTEFVFTVQLRVPRPGPAQTPAADPKALPVHQSELKILCAEDEMINRVIIENLVVEMGHAIAFAENGELALGMLCSGNYDVILMDHRMPVMDGLQATRAIRAAASRVPDREIYIIATTASASSQNQQDCLAAGMNEYITKPIREAELHAALNRAILFNVARGRLLPQNPKLTAAECDIPGLSEEQLLASLEASLQESTREVRELPLKPELVSQYLIDAPKRIEQLRSTLALRDLDALGIAAHSLKNISHYVNAYALSRLAADLESEADAGRSDAIDGLITQITTEFAQIRGRLEAHLLQHSSSPP